MTWVNFFVKIVLRGESQDLKQQPFANTSGMSTLQYGSPKGLVRRHEMADPQCTSLVEMALIGFGRYEYELDLLVTVIIANHRPARHHSSKLPAFHNRPQTAQACQHYCALVGFNACRNTNVVSEPEESQASIINYCLSGSEAYDSKDWNMSFMSVCHFVRTISREPPQRSREATNTMNPGDIRAVDQTTRSLCGYPSNSLPIRLTLDNHCNRYVAPMAYLNSAVTNVVAGNMCDLLLPKPRARHVYGYRDVRSEFEKHGPCILKLNIAYCQTSTSY
ncbi:hypothetical protein J6590_034400 [Homalodisca vitripennis]|nr:hypothetical protein J6590_034400 [Homalodisca vitripennis]